MTGPVVVGRDGSPASVTAATGAPPTPYRQGGRAAREAVDRHLPLVLLHSWTTEPLDVPIAREVHSKQRYGREILERASAELLHRRGDLELTTELVSAPAAHALLERGECASVIVLGSHGHGSVATFLLGSISLRVLGLTPCPAVAVRAGDPAVEAGWGQPAAADRDEVVVGVQEPGAADGPLLEFALAGAADRVRPRLPHRRGAQAPSVACDLEPRTGGPRRPAPRTVPRRRRSARLSRPGRGSS